MTLAKTTHQRETDKFEEVDSNTTIRIKQIVSSTPTVYNITLSNADTQYSQVFPSSTKEFRVKCRTLFDVRYAWVTGKVATPSTPYLTLLAGLEYRGDNSILTSKTLYLASSEAGVVVEVEVWV